MHTRHIYFVRHGETEGESSIRYHGSNDVPLSDDGREQVRRLIPWLSAVKFAAVLHSPLSRAAESAQILMNALAHAPTVVEEIEGFTEIDFGLNEGLTAEEIAEARPEWYRAWKAGQVDGFPDGDTYAGFAERITAAWGEVIDRHPVGDLLVVAHRGTIKQALVQALELDDDSRANTDLGSLTVLQLGPRPELVSLNRLPR